MKEINITGQKREALGKKASKQYRKEGLVPCNIYGEKKCENGHPVAMSFVAPMSELRKLVYTPHIYVVNLIIDGICSNKMTLGAAFASGVFMKLRRILLMISCVF